jgi:hypothetical protein
MDEANPNDNPCAWVLPLNPVERLAKNILKYRASCPHYLHHPYGTHQ